MKLHIEKDLVSQICYFKSQPDPASLGGEQLGGGGDWKYQKILKAQRSG